MIFLAFIGMSPSGKAADFDSAIRGFKSFHPNIFYVVLIKKYYIKINLLTHEVSRETRLRRNCMHS